MARSAFGRALGWGILIGGAAGLISALGKRQAAGATLPPAPALPARPPKQRFHVGDEVSRPGGKVGDVTTVKIVSASLGPGGWSYKLSDGATAGPTDKLFMVEPAAVQTSGPAAEPPIVVATPAVSPPTQGGTQMTKRQARITELLGLVKIERDEAKKKTLADELKRLADEERAALIAPPKVPTPWYMPGLEAKFGSKQAKVLRAWQGGNGVWFYAVDAKLGMPFGLGDGEHTLSQVELREKLAGELGTLMPQQAFPRGVTIFRGGKGGFVVSATVNAQGEYVYQLQGWPNAVTQTELLAILRQAA